MDRQASLYDGLSFPSSSGFPSGAKNLNPYLNFDPSLVFPHSGSSEFIFPDGGTSRHSRGRFELAFSQIGSSVMTGAGIGGSIGAVRGFQSVSSLAGQSLAVQRSQLLNFVTKNGATMANTFGVIALIYSAIGVGLSFIQDTNDDLNTVLASCSTGALFGGLSTPPNNKRNEKALSLGTKLWQLRARRSVVGTLIGGAAAACYILMVNADKYTSRK